MGFPTPIFILLVTAQKITILILVEICWEKSVSNEETIRFKMLEGVLHFGLVKIFAESAFFNILDQNCTSNSLQQEIGH